MSRFFFFFFFFTIHSTGWTIDSDGDGVDDSEDGCPFDMTKTEPGACGFIDVDEDGDGIFDCGCSHKAYIPHQNSNNVYVVDLKGDSVIKIINVGANPIGVATCPGSDRAFIANRGSKTVSIIQISNDSLIGDYQLPIKPWGIACSSNGEFVVSTGSENPNFSAQIAHIDGNSITVESIPLPASLSISGVVISPDNTKAYIALIGNDQVVVIDLLSSSIMGYLDTGTEPNGIDIFPNGEQLAVTNYGAGTISIIDIASNTSDIIPVGTYPQGVAISPDGNKVAVAIQGEDKLCFYDIVADSLSCVGVGSAPNGVSYSVDGLGVAVTMQTGNELWFMDANNLDTLNIIGVGQSPKSLGKFLASTCSGCTDPQACNFDPIATIDDGTCLSFDSCGECGGVGVSGCTDQAASNYNPLATCDDSSCASSYDCNYFGFIPNAFDDNVSVIDLTNDIVTNTITVGDEPLGVATCSSTDRVYIANSKSNNISVIEASTGTLLTNYSCGMDPWSIDCTSNGEKLIISGCPLNATQPVFGVVDLTDLTQPPLLVDIAGTSSGVVISDDNSKAFLALSADDQIAVVNLVTNTVEMYLDAQTTPNGIDVSSDGNWLYVANYGDSSFTIYDLLNETSERISTGPFPEGIELSPNQEELAIAILGNNTVEFYELTTGIATLVDVGIDPNGVSYTQDGSTLLATMQGGNNVYYLDAINHTVIDSIDVGNHPKSLGNFLISQCSGCMNPQACNYNPLANVDNGSCITCDPCSHCDGSEVMGCIYGFAINFDPAATLDDGSCVIEACNPCPSDINWDNQTNIADLLVFLSEFGSYCDHCINGIQDLDETGIDCGGLNCPLCP